MIAKLRDWVPMLKGTVDGCAERWIVVVIDE
jgi:hypothetical protein